MPNTTEFALNAEAESQDGRAYPISPERSRTIQIGATGLCAEHWEYRLEAQRTLISDLLAYVYDTSFAYPPLFTSHYANQGDVRAQSLEGGFPRLPAALEFGALGRGGGNFGKLVLLVLLMKRSVAEKGEHVSAH